MAGLDCSLCGMPEAMYRRCVAAFSEASGGSPFIAHGERVEAAVRAVLGEELFLPRKYAFFARKLKQRFDRVSMSTFELLVAATSPAQLLDGVHYSGLCLTLLFPSKASTLSTGELEDMMRASAPDDMPEETLDELVMTTRKWGDSGSKGFLTRTDFLQLTEQLETMTDELNAELAAAELGERAALGLEGPGRFGSGGGGGGAVAKTSSGRPSPVSSDGEDGAGAGTGKPPKRASKGKDTKKAGESAADTAPAEGKGMVRRNSNKSVGSGK